MAGSHDPEQYEGWWRKPDGDDPGLAFPPVLPGLTEAEISAFMGEPTDEEILQSLRNSGLPAFAMIKDGRVQWTQDREEAMASMIRATIGVWMEDLEIVNEIIRVVGYERLEVLIDMLEDRLFQVQPQLARESNFGWQYTKNPDATDTGRSPQDDWK